MLRSPQSSNNNSATDLNKTVTVRRSVGEIEARISTTQLVVKPKPTEKLAEAKSCLIKAKLQLGNSRNIKTEIRQEVTAQVERLYQIIKDLVAESRAISGKTKGAGNENLKEVKVDENREDLILETLKHNNQLLIENKNQINKLGSLLESTTTDMRSSYADVLSSKNNKTLPDARALHSVVVTSRSELDTGEQVIEKIRSTIKAKDGWIRVEKVKKAKDRKVIIGCASVEERDKVKKKLGENESLEVEEMKNKSPLLVFRDVLRYNEDTDIQKALVNQNAHIFEGLEEDDRNIDILYRKRTRNPLQCHIVARVTPRVWKRWTHEEKAYIDIQKVRVEDQSPLVQCSRCLAYGHTKKYCREEKETCCHCAGPHLRAECDKWRQREAPKCCNCDKAGIGSSEHGAFAAECPIRKRWDTLARSTISYC